MLTKSEFKVLKMMEDKERKKVLIYIVLGIAIMIGVFFGSTGLILKENSLKLLGFIWLFLGIMPIIGIREQLKLYRIIKKLQGELEENQQKNHSPETK